MTPSKRPRPPAGSTTGSRPSPTQRSWSWTTRSGAILFFQLVNRRYEHASTVVTSNKGFEQWGEILHDEVMAAALLDRLLHRCHIVNIRGNSYRMRRHMELSKAIHPTASRAVSAEHAGNGETGS
ncbi:MAG: ATP-binding protein [Gammaproteobacteria bacterium]|nr:ATP-binding protein [Gammaproteobacteria bacterium]